MTHDNPPEEDLTPSEMIDELRALGQNLRNALQSVWDSEERKKVQKEISTGLADLSATINQTVRDFSSSPAGQTLKSDVEDLQARIRTGDVELKIYNELLGALRKVNDELKKATSKDQTSGSGE